MMHTQWALVRREIWEHRSLYVVPLVLSLVVVLTSITGQVAVSSAGDRVDIAILGASNLGETERSAAINVLMMAMTWVFILTMGIVTIFYALDSLYAERRDKSILFWRSLPVTDAETVLSKVLMAAIVIPAITFAVIVATHLLVLTVTSVWVGMRGADPWQLIWSAAPFADNWIATAVILPAMAVWVSPFVGWFLFASAFAKRSPFLFAFLPLVILPMLERILLGSKLFAETLFERVPFGLPIFRHSPEEHMSFDSEEELMELAQAGVSLLSLLDIGHFLTAPSVWLGLIVCALFCTAAIYVRRYRGES